ncbi:hypothetical protein OG422_25830 [Streptomyces sp. NBC_01525]|nr:hypothetical protein [Streptomyces benahoarensis]
MLRSPRLERVREHGPEPFPLRLAFRPTGELSGGRIVAARDLRADG